MYKSLSVNSVFCIVILTAFLFFSCTPQKNNTYFQTIPYNSELQTLITKDFEHKIKPDDVLLITFSGASPEIVKYNTNPEGYLVDKTGNIQLYTIGDVKVGGLTLTQVKDRLVKTLTPNIFKQISVTTRFKNHKIIVLGEVGSPGVINMETEHMSLIEAIALQGDLNDNASKDKILIIRNTEKGKIFYRVNLLDGSVFNSDFYYLQAEDIVYVEAETKKKDAATSASQIFTYVISGLSFLFLIFNRINR